jgi:hypothetical protein
MSVQMMVAEMGTLDETALLQCSYIPLSQLVACTYSCFRLLSYSHARPTFDWRHAGVTALLRLTRCHFAGKSIGARGCRRSNNAAKRILMLHYCAVSWMPGHRVSFWQVAPGCRYQRACGSLSLNHASHHPHRAGCRAGDAGYPVAAACSIGAIASTSAVVIAVISRGVGMGCYPSHHASTWLVAINYGSHNISLAQPAVVGHRCLR